MTNVLVPLMTVLLLAAVGLSLTAEDFARVRRQPLVVLTGLLAPLVVLPLVGHLTLSIFAPGPETTAGLLLVAACPIGGMSTVFAHLAGASPALSVSLTTLSSALAVVTIPLVSHGLVWLTGESLGLAAPVPYLAKQLTLVLTLPLLVGFWLRRRFPELSQRSEPVLRRASFAGIALVLALVIAQDFAAFLDELSGTLPLAASFIALSGAAGWLVALLVTEDRRDRLTLAIEFGTRNIGVALAVAVSVLGRPDFARFGAAYFLVEVPLMLALATLARRRLARAPVP